MLKWMKVIIQIGILAIIYQIGSLIQQYFNLFVPGSVIGLILLFILLFTGIVKLQWIEMGAEFMVKHIVIFFIPAVVGIISYYHVFSGKGSLLILTTLISTVLVMAISGILSEKLSRDKGNEK